MTSLEQSGVTPLSPLLVRAFGVIARRRLRGAFRAVRVLHPERLSDVGDGPLIMYLNHPSWWDPLLCLAMAQRLLKGRANYGPISATALLKYPMFRRLGMFPVEQNSARGAAQFLRGAQGVLASGGTLWVTAQGQFTDARIRPVTLKPGLGALLARSEGATVVPVAVEYTFWNQRLPEALIAIGEPLRVHGAREQSSAEWTVRLATALEATQDQLAQEAMLRDEARFTTLLEGARGTAGIYGVWQRLRSRARGERWKPDHAADTEVSERSRVPHLREAKVGLRAGSEPASIDKETP